MTPAHGDVTVPLCVVYPHGIGV